MDPKKIAELEAAAAAAKEAADKAGGTDEALNSASKDADDALAKAKAPSHKPEYTEKQKAAFALKKNAERLAELGGNPAEVLNIRPSIQIDEDISDDTPMTVGTFRAIQKKDAHKSALQMAEDLPEEERDEVIALLESRIVPSGDPQADLLLARAAVNARHNAQIAEHISQRSKPKVTAAGGSGEAVQEQPFVPTELESTFMKKPYNMTKEKILALRVKAAQVK